MCNAPVCAKDAVEALRDHCGMLVCSTNDVCALTRAPKRPSTCHLQKNRQQRSYLNQQLLPVLPAMTQPLAQKLPALLCSDDRGDVTTAGEAAGP